MLIEYLPVLILIGLAVVIALVAVGLGIIFGPRRPSEKKAMPYRVWHGSVWPGHSADEYPVLSHCRVIHLV